MTYTYRKAELSDIGALVQLRADFMACFGPADEKGREALGNYEAFLLEGMGAPHNHPGAAHHPSQEGNCSFAQWLAERDGEIAATGSVSFWRMPPTTHCPSGKAAYIGNMFTYPAHRSRGLAGEILRLLADEARAAGCHALFLHASDQGRPLYEGYGFAASESMMEYKF